MNKSHDSHWKVTLFANIPSPHSEGLIMQIVWSIEAHEKFEQDSHCWVLLLAIFPDSQLEV